MSSLGFFGLSHEQHDVVEKFQFHQISLCRLHPIPCFPPVGHSSTQLGEIVIDVVEEEQPSDGYWDWYVQHISQIAQFNRELTEVRIQLAHLASEISRAKAMRFNLAKMRMEWLVAKDESINFAGFNLGKYFESAIRETAKVGPKARETNQRRSQKLGDDIQA